MANGAENQWQPRQHANDAHRVARRRNNRGGSINMAKAGGSIYIDMASMATITYKLTSPHLINAQHHNAGAPARGSFMM